MTRDKFRAYVDMTKPRIVLMVVITCIWGYVLAHPEGFGLLRFVATLIGIALGAAGGAVLNNYLERDFDARMNRTKGRALPTGTMKPGQALVFGLYLIMAGEIVLLWQVNLLTAFLVLMSNFLYVLVYTPMKRLSTLNTTLGAVPGAIPPVVGWTAATGQLGLEAVVLFLILFVWQHPHFYAIAWMYRDDYAKAGFRMLSCEDQTGGKTAAYVVAGTLALIAVSVLPTVLGMTSMVYLGAALALGVMVLLSAIAMQKTRSYAEARRVLKATVIYLPLILVAIVVDSLI